MVCENFGGRLAQEHSVSHYSSDESDIKKSKLRPQGNQERIEVGGGGVLATIRFRIICFSVSYLNT
jgi:hypothetical protein